MAPSGVFVRPLRPECVLGALPVDPVADQCQKPLEQLPSLTSRPLQQLD